MNVEDDPRYVDLLCQLCGSSFHAWHRSKFCSTTCKYQAFKLRRASYNRGQPDPRVRSLAGQIGQAIRWGQPESRVAELRDELRALNLELKKTSEGK